MREQRREERQLVVIHELGIAAVRKRATLFQLGGQLEFGGNKPVYPEPVLVKIEASFLPRQAQDILF